MGNYTMTLTQEDNNNNDDKNVSGTTSLNHEVKGTLTPDCKFSFTQSFGVGAKSKFECTCEMGYDHAKNGRWKRVGTDKTGTFEMTRRDPVAARKKKKTIVSLPQKHLML